VLARNRSPPPQLPSKPRRKPLGNPDKLLQMNRMFRILSLDGGGIKGTFSAAALAALEEATGKRCVEQFDLITGTSTGGIIAIGLGLGKSAAEIVEFFREHGPTIFPGTSLVERTTGLWRWLWGPKHSHDVLRDALTRVLGDKRLALKRACC
jgi:patatin-like phospholipase/acyl hydrolase